MLIVFAIKNFIKWILLQIDTCLLENIARNLTAQQDRVNFYTNITSCILARSRCNAYNPITGELQTFNRGYSSIFGAQSSLSNALQISTSGDLRVISFSQKVGVSNLFCSAQSTLDQAGYGVTTCWILLCSPQHCECIRKEQTRACSNKLYLVSRVLPSSLKKSLRSARSLLRCCSKL